MPNDILIQVESSNLIRITSIEYGVTRIYDLDKWALGAAVENFIDTEL